MSKSLLLSAVAAIALSGWAQADARAFQNFYGGTVVGGVDALGVFGAAGADLQGARWRALVHVDDALTANSSGVNPVSGQASSIAIDGNGPVASGPQGIYVQFTINGRTATFGNGDNSYVQAGSGPTYNLSNADVRDFSQIQVGGSSVIAQTEFYSEMTSNLDPLQLSDYKAAYRSFAARPYPNDYAFFTEQLSPGGGMTLSLNLDAVSLAAPEPQTWSMMLLGLGGLGAVMRRRRAVACA